MSETLERRIEERAYALWEAAGKPDGKSLEYWLAAETALRDQELHKELDESFPASDPPASVMRGG